MGQQPMFLFLVGKGFHIRIAAVAQGRNEKVSVLDFAGCLVNHQRQHIPHPIDEQFFAAFTLLAHGNAFSRSLGPLPVPQTKLTVSEGLHPVLPLLQLVGFPQILQIHVTMVKPGMNGGKIRLRLTGLTLF